MEFNLLFTSRKAETGNGKGVAVHALVIIILIGFFLFFMILVLGGFINVQNCEMSSAVCANRRMAFCLDWWMKDQAFSTSKPEWTAVNTCENAGDKANFYPCPEPSPSECQGLTGKK